MQYIMEYELLQQLAKQQGEHYNNNILSAGQ